MHTLRSVAFAVVPALLAGSFALTGCSGAPSGATYPILADEHGSARNLTAAGGYVYWSQSDASASTWSIQRVPEAGGDPETIVADVTQPGGLAVDGSRVYWTDAAGGRLLAAPVSGLRAGSAPTPIATGLASPSMLVVAGGAAYVLEAAGNLTTSVERIGLADSARATVALPASSVTLDMASDGSAAYFDQVSFLASGGVSSAILRSATGDAAPTQLASVPHLVSAIAVGGADAYLAVDDDTDSLGQVWSMPIDGPSASPTTLASGVDIRTESARVLAATPDAVLWVGQQGLWSIPAAGGAPGRLSDHDVDMLTADGRTALGVEFGADGDSVVVESR